jgi:hypothetical protein
MEGGVCSLSMTRPQFPKCKWAASKCVFWHHPSFSLFFLEKKMDWVKDRQGKKNKL